ncbi:MAG: NFACT RNA binding domain-containing protein [Oscillospiraceae bacterium]
MALDGIFLRQLQHEIYNWGIGARVDKIAQPSREELIITMRQKGSTRKLLICMNVGNPRINFTETKVENPMSPPMFCMLLRKHISGAKLSDVKQIGLDRILHLCFDTTNELGDPVTLILAVEIMGRHSNCIFIGADGRVIDSIKRIDIEMSSVRPILPGITYTLPPQQNKLNLEQITTVEALTTLKNAKDIPLSKALLNTFEGLSPLICREIALAVDINDNVISQQNEMVFNELTKYIEQLKLMVTTGICTPTTILQLTGKPSDFSFMPILQYGNSMQIKTYPSCSELLDEFYSRRDLMSRMKVRSSDLLKFLSNAMDRITRKLALQEVELKTCGDRQQLKIYGDLINANLYGMNKGQASVTVQNFYDEALPNVEIALDIMLTPAQNAQKYYSEYRKAATAEDKLSMLMKQAQTELEYLESVYDLLARATTNAEIDQIREELAEGKYLRVQKGRDKSSSKLPPKKYISDDGFIILVGRNNIQNDRLTLKESKGMDMWFHTKDIPGSHVVVVADGKAIPDSTLTQAAIIAAVCSKAENSPKVPVNYTPIKYVKKPVGAKPGMVIYHVYQTAYVTPDVELEKRLRVV